MQTLSARLVSQNIASSRDVEKALGRQLLYGGDLATNLMELGTVAEPELVALLAETHGLDPAPSGELPRSSPQVLRLVAGDTAWRHDFYPLGRVGEELEVAVSEPLSAPLKEELETSLRVTLVERAAPLVRIRQAVARDYQLALDRRSERVLAKLQGLPDPHPSEAPGRLAGEQRRPLWSPSLPDHVPHDFDELVPSTRQHPLAHEEIQIPPLPRPPLASTPGVQGEGRVPAGPGLEARPLAAPVPPPRISLTPLRARHFGPLTPEAAEHALFLADTRDQILRVFFAFVSQYFDYSALFAVHGDLAEGRDARGPGASRERLNHIGLSLDLPSSMASVRDTGQMFLGCLSEQGLDASLVRDLERGFSKKVLLLPVAVRGRTVLVLYGDHGAEDVEASVIGDVLTFAHLAAKALEISILRRKHTPGRSMPAPAAEPPAAREPAPEPRLPKTLVTGGLKLNKDAPFVPRTPVSSHPPTDEPPEEGWELEPRTRPGLGSEARAFLGRAAKPLPDASHDRRPISESPPTMASLEGDKGDKENKGDTVPAKAASDRAAPPETIRQPDPTSGVEDGEIEDESPSRHDLDGECRELTERLLQGDNDAGARLLEAGSAAARALAMALPGPINKEWKSGGPRPMRASECGPVLYFLSRLGSLAVSAVAARSREAEPIERVWATRLLGELPGPESARGIVERLVDEDPDVRHAAMEVSMGLRSETIVNDPELAKKLRAFAADPMQSGDARKAAVESLGKLRDPFAVECLIHIVERGDPELRDAAYAALKVITRQDFGRGGAAWHAWWRLNSARHRVEWLIDAITHIDAATRREAGEELKNLTKEYFGYYDDLPERERARAQERYREWWKTRGHARFGR